MLEDVGGAADMPEPPTCPVQNQHVVNNFIPITDTRGDMPWGWFGMGMTNIPFGNMQQAWQCCFEECTLSFGTRAIKSNVFSDRPDRPIQLAFGSTDAIRCKL